MEHSIPPPSTPRGSSPSAQRWVATLAGAVLLGSLALITVSWSDLVFTRRYAAIPVALWVLGAVALHVVARAYRRACRAMPS